MINRVVTILLLFLLSTLNAEEQNMLLDEYHDELCNILVDTSNSIDDYFVDSNSTESSTTRAELINSFAIENNQNFEKDIRLRLRLSLPKIQKNLRLFFEDETQDNTLYDSTKLTDKHLNKKKYYLRLEYFKFVKNKLNTAVAAGVRIRHSHLVPYLNIRSHYDLYQQESINSELYNRFRYYIDGEISNAFEFNSKYTLEDRVDFFWRNQLSYSNQEEFQTIINDISGVKTINHKEQIGLGFGVVSQLKNFKNLNIDYAHIHGLFQHTVYRNWFYYQVVPSVLWRESNNFKISYRYMMNFGVIFDSKLD